MRRRPVLLAMSILAGLSMIVGGSAFAEVVPAKWAALAVLVVGGAQLAVQFWVQGRVTPVADPRDDRGRMLQAWAPDE